MRCVKCDAALRSGDEAGAALGSPPLSALLFYTRGAEDSDVFSPEPGRADCEYLRIGLCDSCLIEAGERGAVEHGTLEAELGQPLPGRWEHRRWRMPPPATRPLPLARPGDEDEDEEMDGLAGEYLRMWKEQG